MNRYYNPVQTVEGPGCAGELAALLREMALEEGRVLLLVWNEDVLKLPTFMELADAGFMVCSLVFRASNPRWSSSLRPIRPPGTLPRRWW